MNELKKEYCVKIKLIAHDWQCVTLISWFQMNHYVHSSPDLHKVEGEHIFFLEKLKITPWKSLLFWCFFVKLFLITFVHICISQNTNDITSILHTCVILFLLYCWLFDDSALVLGPASEKDKKTIASSCFHGKLNFFEKLHFKHFFDIC